MESPANPGRFNGSQCYYANGIYDQASGSQYVVVPARMGATVLGLPKGAKQAMVGGTEYYTYAEPFVRLLGGRGHDERQGRGRRGSRDSLRNRSLDSR